MSSIDHSPSREAAPEPPDDLRLLPGEVVLSVVEHPARPVATSRLSSLEQVLRLTRSESSADIGTHGPSLAALALGHKHARSKTEAPDHLRLYEAVFGRDSLRVAIDLISSYPKLARSTVIALAELQGLEYNREREEEPGRIVHEARQASDPIAQQLTKERGWGWPYYGSVDATPEFIHTMTAYCRVAPEGVAFLDQTYTDRHGRTRTVHEALAMALAWIERRLDANPEGLLEFQSQLPNGIENQVWKDSWDAYHHANGTIANHAAGIASIEVQTTTYDALLDAALLYRHAPDVTEERVTALEERAKKLKQAILRNFWTEEKGGYFVLGTDRGPDGRLRQLQIRTSNMGHTLNSRLLEGENLTVRCMRHAVVRQLASSELLAPSGIRTLASDEFRFRSNAYQNGSVWLWDTHHIAKGLRRHGYDAMADDLDQRILYAAEVTGMFPEYVSGDTNPVPHINQRTIDIWDERQQRTNRLEQPPQEVQAWTVAAILATKHRRNRRRR